MASLSKPLKSAAFIGRYKRYKAGTKQVIEWLARTADRVGDLASCLDCLRPKANGTKLSKADIETIRIKTHELKKLAALIADSDPPVGVPREVLQVLEDVIAGRQACASWYASQAIGDVSELASQNDSHAHFIHVLKQVQHILRPAEQNEESQEPTRLVVAGATEKPINIFNMLDLEEAQGTDSESEATPSYLRPAPKVKKLKNKTKSASAHQKPSQKSSAETLSTKSSVTRLTAGHTDDPQPPYAASAFEMEQSDESDAFALWCHLADLNDIRMSVKDTWAEYSQGKITLDVAGVITETAFGMMKQTHEEFISYKPRFKAWWGLSLFLGLKTAYNNNVVYTFSKDPLAKVAEARFEMKQADLSCAAAALLLRVFREACQMSLRDALKYKKSFHDQPYPTGLIGGSPKTEFESILFSFAPEIAAHVACNRMRSGAGQLHYHTYFTDELATLVALNSEPIEPSIWLVVATQTCMDIHDAFDSTSCAAVIQRTVSLSKNIVRGYDHFHSVPPFAHVASPTDKKYLERFLCRCELTNSATTCRKLGDKQGFHSRFFFPGLRALPHVAGEINYLTKIRMHVFGTRASNDCDAVMIMSYLYKAARKYGLEMEVWQDLEMVIANHNLIGKTKPNADAYAMLRRFLLDMGTEAPSKLPNKIPSTAFAGKKSITEADSDLIAAMSGQYRNWDHPETKTSSATTLQAVLTGLATKSRVSNPVQQRRFTPVELLATLKQELIATETRVNFDYVGFSRQCISLLTKFVDTAMSKAPAVDQGQNGPAAVYYLLKAAADVDASSASSNLLSTIFADKGKPGVANTPFAAGIRVLQDALKDGQGKIYSQAAFNQSSGRLRKENRPLAAPNPERVIGEAAIQKFMAQLGPGVSCASSRRTIELYDPTGNLEKSDWIFNSRSMDPITGALMPYGISDDVRVIVPESIEDFQDFTEGFSRPNLNLLNDPMWNDSNRSEDYLSYEEAMALERKAKEQIGMLRPRKQ